MEPQLVIFDLDGTVIADEEAYGNAFRKVLSSLGIENKEKYPHRGGIGVRANWLIFINKYKIKTDKTTEELMSLTQKEYLKGLKDIKIKKGFKDFIHKLKNAGFKTALATSNEWYVVEKILDHFVLGEIFDAVTTAEELGGHKPDPEVFLITAEKLGIDPEYCVVFEDSIAGVNAARNASMKVVAIARSKESIIELSKADQVIRDFSAITVDDIYKLFIDR